MGTTELGFPYPEGTDLVMEGDDAIEALAQAIDALWPEAGLVSVPSPGNGQNGSVTVTFALGKFQGPPAVVVTPNTGAPANVRASVTGTTTTGATVVVRREDSGNSTPVHMIASERLLDAPAALLRTLAADDPPGSDEDGIDLELVTVTCPTDGCRNQGAPLEIYAPPGGTILCGRCGTPLTPAPVGG